MKTKTTPVKKSSKPKLKTNTTKKKKKSKTLLAYKAFSENFTCRGFPYQVGRVERTLQKPVLCQSGFHACENPLALFMYYPESTSRYAVVRLSGSIAQDHKEKPHIKKFCSSELKVLREIPLKDLLEEAFRYKIPAKTKKKFLVTSSPLVRNYNYLLLSGSFLPVTIVPSMYKETASDILVSGSRNLVRLERNCSLYVSGRHNIIQGGFPHTANVFVESEFNLVSLQGPENLVVSANRGYNKLSSGSDGVPGVLGGVLLGVYTGDQQDAFARDYFRGSVGTIFSVLEKDGKENKLKLYQATVGKRGIRPDVWYELRNGRFVQTKDLPADYAKGV